ncbi:hypothetical protein NLX83_35955 [Allokutzneria sp. A3M-2-11 16]|uniref:hypothetical protein n=1 Tax=Allokutzneria sp. A3M-2-11 16 TaxID=2962043 RepID=UPI0020B747AC|nr:hypothetical protein [Allokutzneria sp. A3M-2-11 16]MCP3804677.1 hypothetical protein [Allokutzneria sp. A3M-2-11 16]
MRRWLAALAVAVVTTGVGIAVNVATDLGSNMWAWIAVAVLTLAAAVVAVWAMRPPKPPTVANSQNVISGDAAGSTVQANTINGDVHLG